MKTVDSLIVGGIVITMAGPGVGIIPEGVVAIQGNQIEAVGDKDTVLSKYKAHRYFDASQKAIVPGFIDGHIHTGIAICRGLAQDIDHWMQKGVRIFTQHLTREDSIAGSAVNIIEGIKAGTTTFFDYNVHMSSLLQNHARIGSRCCASDVINEMKGSMTDLEIGDLYPFDPSLGQESLQRNLALFEQWHEQENGRITCLLGPQGPDMLSRELLLEIKKLVHDLDTSIHMHVAQGDRETIQIEQRYGKRSIPFLEEIGYLDERLLAVHLTDATSEEAQLLARRGAAMILCSGSIGIIDGLVPPLSDFLKKSNRAALGSDQAPGNNCNNMLNEMKLTAILNKCKAKDPKVFPAWKTLRLATIDGARALNMGDKIGSLEAGKKADIVMIDLTAPSMIPVIQDPIRNIVPNLVYSASGSEVDTVLIDGNVVMEQRKILTVNEEEIIQRAQKAGEEMAERSKEEFRKVWNPLADMQTKDCL